MGDSGDSELMRCTDCLKCKSKALQKILLTAFSGRLVNTFDMVIMSLNAIEYILFEFKNLQYPY